LLKKETRILGLSTIGKKRLKPIVGAIFRGSLWLDAIMTYLPTESSQEVPTLTSVLRKSKQYSQIHAAIFSREDVLEGGIQDYRRLSQLVKFPVFAIAKKPRKTLQSRELVIIKREGTRIPLWINDYDPERAAELYSLACADGYSTPEAVRVAELVAYCSKYPESRIC